MNKDIVKRELVRAVVRIITANFTTARRSSTDDFIATLFGGESYEDRMARDLEKAFDEVVDGAKKTATKVKFNRIVKHL